MDLREKVAVVTGGARGIGRGIAMALAHEGAHVAVADLYRPGQTTAGYALSSARSSIRWRSSMPWGCKPSGCPSMSPMMATSKRW